MRRNRRLVLISHFAILTLAVGCGSDSAAPMPDARDVAVADASTGAESDAAADAAPAPAMLDGIAGMSCAAGCEALGKTCVAACTEHRSCGSHDGVPPPYAGYACYFWENDDGTFRSNDGRSFTSCDDEATLTWDNFGTLEELGDYLGGNPVSCCCQ